MSFITLEPGGSNPPTANQKTQIQEALDLIPSTQARMRTFVIKDIDFTQAGQYSTPLDPTKMFTLREAYVLFTTVTNWTVVPSGVLLGTTRSTDFTGQFADLDDGYCQNTAEQISHADWGNGVALVVGGQDPFGLNLDVAAIWVQGGATADALVGDAVFVGVEY